MNLKLRRIVSLTSLLCLALLLVTSIVLYVVPEGRIAYWSDWHLWGLTKTQWGDVHVVTGFLFLVAGIIHLVYNWKPVVSYLRDRARRLRVFTPEASVSLVLAAFFVIGALAGWPPMSWILGLGESIKDRAAVTYGEPPYGHAELSSLETVARRMGFDLAPALDRLRAAGFADAEPRETLLEIAARRGVPPQAVYLAMRLPEAERAPGAGMPPVAPPGTGRRTLADVCAEYGLPVPEALRILEAAGFEAAADRTLKDIGEARGRTGTDVYDALRAARRRAAQ